VNTAQGSRFLNALAGFGNPVNSYVKIDDGFFREPSAPDGAVRSDHMPIGATYTDWYIGFSLSFFVIVVVVIIVSIILTLAARIADQARTAAAGVDVVRAQTTSLDKGVELVNDCAVRILHMARSLRKVAVGK